MDQRKPAAPVPAPGMSREGEAGEEREREREGKRNRGTEMAIGGGRRKELGLVLVKLLEELERKRSGS